MGNKKLEGLSIALTGEMRCGKDEVGRILVEEYMFKRYGFGDGIRKVCQSLFPHEFEGAKPRKLLQEFGQDQVRRHSRVWVDYCFREMLYDGVDPVVDNVVITDLRQPHEYEALVESGFTIIRVNTKGHIRKQRMELAGEEVNDEILRHETELHIRSFEVDFEIDNNGTHEQLRENVKALMSNITGGIV